MAGKVEKTHARISAKRLLPVVRAAGYEGSARNFRRLVAAEKKAWRQANAGSRRPAVWAPGGVLAIDWGVLGGLHVFCAVLAFSRVRFVRLLHHSVVVATDGESYRMRQARTRGGDRPTTR